MKGLEDYVNVVKRGENIYYLNAKGREIVNCNKVRKHTGNVEHYIMRNYLFIACGKPSSWKNEIRIKNGSTKSDTITIVPDAMFEKKGFWHVVEVDNTQTMQVNQTKAKKYRELVERKAFGEKPPIFLWVTTTPFRKKKLLDLFKGLKVFVYTIDDFKKGGL
jgi:hypothetical protein